MMKQGTGSGRYRVRRRRRIAAAALCAWLTLPALPAFADVETLETERERTAERFDALAREIELTDERMAQIEAEIEAIRNDNAAVSAALVQVAKTERKLTQDIADIGTRLDALRLQETGIRTSLAGRRDVLAEVLGALQRMGLNPPPAILVSPEDVLSSVRSSILLASVVPDLRAETEILIGDLAELSRVSTSIANERQRLERTVTQQAEEKQRLSLLLEEKRLMQERSEEMLLAEQARSEELAREAGDLGELIDALEADIEIARAAAEKARQEQEQARLEAEDRAAEPQPQPQTPTRSEPLQSLPGAMPFATRRAQVALPAAGRIARRYGEDDGDGSVMQGDMVATHSGAIVTAPADGTILYAGPFRSYGQLLILDAGDGYHIVLAGMGRISVARGQNVLAGEPVGVMAETMVASAAPPGGDDAGSELYVEFRQEGKPVDPAPWWAERSSGRTGNDT